MKRIVYTITIAAVLLAWCCSVATGVRKPLPDRVNGAAIDIIVEGICHPEGVVRVALFDSPEGFPGKVGGARRRTEVPANGETVRVTFGDVPPGRYAISVHHDRDADGRMATDRLGRPLECYGTSNNVRGQFGPPTFTAAVFIVEEERRVIEITLESRRDE